MQVLISKVKIPLRLDKGATVIKGKEVHASPNCDVPFTKQNRKVYPHPSMRNKLQEFRFHLFRRIDRTESKYRDMTDAQIMQDPEAAAEVARITILSVEQKGQGAKSTLTIEGRQKGGGGNSNTIKPGSILMDSEVSDYAFSGEMSIAWAELQRMATMYLDFKLYDVENVPQADPSQPNMFPRKEAEHSAEAA